MIPRFVMILISCFFFCTANASNSWETTKLSGILEDGSLFFGDEIGVMYPVGIDQASFSTKDACFRRPILRSLRNTWVNETVQVKKTEETSLVIVKHKTLGNLSQYILSHGMGRIDESSLSSYYKGIFRISEKQAQEENLGIWNGCGQDIANRVVRSIRQRMYFKHRHEGFLAPVAVGRVIKVLSGNLVELENGVIIKLLGIKLPEIKKKELGATNSKVFDLESCFSNESKEFLSNLVLGKQIIWRADYEDFDKRRNLLRYGYLAYDDGEELFINEYLIKHGYGKSHWEGLNLKYKDKFETIQALVYASPKGAWSFCAKKLMEHTFNDKKEEKEVIYSEKCRIKGNISGTKKNPIKKYHTPLSPWYKRITKPERCFETEEDARKKEFIKVK